MHTGRFVFSGLIAHLPHQEFQKCVARYDDHPQPRKLSYWDQYLAMAFAQLSLPREPAGHRSLPPIRDRETITWGSAPRWLAALGPPRPNRAPGASWRSFPWF